MAGGNYAPAVAAISIAVAAALLLRNSFTYDPVSVERAMNMDFSTPPPWPIFYGVSYVSDFLSKLERALLPPPLVALEDSFGFMRAQIIYALTKLRIADLLKEKPRSAEELAAAVSVPEAQKLYRVLRAAESFGYFHEDSDGVWHNTVLTSVLTTDHANSVVSLVQHLKEDCYVPWSKTLEAVTSKGPGDEAFKSVHDGKSFWEYLQENPVQLAQYRKARAAFKSMENWGPSHDFAWDRFTRVVHLGASDGSFLSSVLAANPHLTALAFDLPDVIKAITKPSLKSLGNKVAFESGDFFQASSLPAAKDGDAFVLHSTLSNWDDERAAALLRNVRAALGSKNATLVIVEPVPKPTDATPTRALLDIHAMVVLGGKERTPVDYVALLKTCGFDVQAVVTVRSLNRVVVANPE